MLDLYSQIENYGEFISWKADSHLFIIMQTDVKHLCELVIRAFVHNQNIINNGFPINRIETVNTTGTPQPLDQIINFVRTPARTGTLDFNQHLNVLKDMTALAYQANEYITKSPQSHNKPDLIVSNNVQLADSDIQDTSIVIEVTDQKEVETIGTCLESITDTIDGTKSVKLNGESPEIIQSVLKTSNSALNLNKENGEISKFGKEAVDVVPCDIKNVPNNAEVVSSDAENVSTDVKVNPNDDAIIPSDVADISSVEEVGPHDVDIIPSHLEILQNARVSDPPTKPQPTSNILQSPPILSQTKTEIFSQSMTHNLKHSNNTLNKKDKAKNFKASKPPNILVYCESSDTRNNVIQTLENVVDSDKYTVYPLTKAQIDSRIWLENATLLVVAGNVTERVGKLLLDFFLYGGKVLCLCTDLLHIIIPTYRTAEVRENELVQFSYNKWKNVKMMHHIFCYQPSPVKKHFSHDNEEIFTTPGQP